MLGWCGSICGVINSYLVWLVFEGSYMRFFFLEKLYCDLFFFLGMVRKERLVFEGSYMRFFFRKTFLRLVLFLGMVRKERWEGRPNGIVNSSKIVNPTHQTSLQKLLPLQTTYTCSEVFTFTAALTICTL